MKNTIIKTKLGILSILLSLLGLNLTAQSVQITVNVPPPYSIHLDDYLTFENQSVITLTNTTNSPVQLKLIASIAGDNGAEGHVKDQWIPNTPISLGANEMKVLVGNQLKSHYANITQNDLELSGVNFNTLIRSGTLPEGSYQYCVKALDFNTSQPLSTNFGCARFVLTNYDPPTIIIPQNEEQLTAQNPQFVNFTWSPTGMAGITRYKIELVDMTAVGLFNPNDAFSQEGLIQPYFSKENIVATTHMYSVSDPALIVSHQYAIRVTAYDPNNQISFKNEGRSAVTTFTYKEAMNFVNVNPNIQINSNPPDQNQAAIEGFNNNIQIAPPSESCVSNTKYNGTIQNSTLSSISNGQSILAGLFTVNNTVFTKNSGGSFSGKGNISVAFLNTMVEVEFTNIKLDNNRRLKSGIITGKVSSNSIINTQMSQVKTGVMETYPNASALQSKIKEANRKVSNLNPNAAVDLPISLDNENYNLGIVGMIFESKEAFINAFLPVDIPQAFNNEWLNMSSKGIAIQPGGFGDTEIIISLAKDVNVKLSNEVSLNINKGNNKTFIKMNCEGFQSLTIDGNFELSRKIALPVDDNDIVIEDASKKVHAKFNVMATDNFENFILEGLNFNHNFAIAEGTDFIIYPGTVAFDFSTMMNADNFDQNNPGKGADWIGLYVESLSLKFPKGFKDGEDRIEVGVENLMVDKLGVSVHLFAEGDLVSQGNVASWGFELDKVDLKIEKSKFSAGGFSGSVKLPISDKGNFNFSASVSKGTNGANIEMSVEALDDYEANLFLAKMELYNGSKITFKKDANQNFEATALLNGSIGIDLSSASAADKKKSNVKKFQLPSLAFQELSIQGKDEPNYTPYVDFKFIELQNQNNIQGMLSDAFELELNTLSFTKKQEGGVQMLGLSIDMGLAILGGGEGEEGSTGPTAGTKFTIWAGYDPVAKTYKYKKAELNKLALSGDIGVAKVSGSIDIYNEDATFGNGFRGNVKVDVTGIGLGLEVTTQFGRTLANAGNFKYFYFDAMLKLPDPGLVIPSTCASIYGFGGGAYCNMERVSGFDEALLPEDYVAGVSGKEGAPTSSGVEYKPKKGKGGFKASVLFGLSGKKEAFNGDLTFSMEFDAINRSVSFIRMDGVGYIMQNPLAKPRSLGSARVKCEAGIELNLQNRVFSGSFGVAIDAQTIEGSGMASFRFQLPPKDPKGNIITQPGLAWHIKLGYWTPNYNPFEDPNRIKATVGYEGIVDYNVKFQTYFMVGNDLPSTMPPLPSYILDLTESMGAEPAKQLPSEVSNTQNLAFAFGAGMQFNAGFNFKGLLYAELQAEAAFDVLIANMNAECNGEQIGFGGWYAQGRAYAFAEGKAGAIGIKVAHVTAGAYFDIKTPNPTYMKGAVYLKAKVLGVEGKERKGEFEKGELCNIETEFDPFNNAKLISHVVPSHKHTGVDIYNPKIEAHFEYGQWDLIKMYDPYNDKNHYYTFDWQVRLEDSKGYEIPCKLMAQNKKVQLIPEENLEEQTEYTIRIKAYVKFGKETIESESIKSKFTTGEKIPFLGMAHVIKSYPFERQRFFMKEDFDGNQKQGFLYFNNDHCDLINDNPNGVKAFARFHKLGSDESWETECNCTFSSGRTAFRYDIPTDLTKETIFELKIIKRQTNDNPNPNINQIAAGSDVFQTIFRGLYFRTSRYDNMKEKLSALQGKAVVFLPANEVAYINSNYGVAPNVNSYKIPVLLFKGVEPFEKYEIYYKNEGFYRNLSVTDDNTDLSWSIALKNKYRAYNTLPNSPITDMMKTWAIQSPEIKFPEGYPMYGDEDHALKGYGYAQDGLKWMKNFDYYENKLKTSGAMPYNETISKPMDPLSHAEINMAKGQGGMVNQMNNMQISDGQGGEQGNGIVLDLDEANNNVGTKYTAAIIDFKPFLANYEKAKLDNLVLSKASIQGPYVFYNVWNSLQSLDWPEYKKGQHKYLFKYNQAVGSTKKTNLKSYLIIE